MKRTKQSLLLLIAMIGIIIGLQAKLALGGVVYTPTRTIIVDGQQNINGEWVEQ